MALPIHTTYTFLDNIFLQPEEKIQDYLNQLSQVIFDLNESLEQRGIAF